MQPPSSTHGSHHCLSWYTRLQNLLHGTRCYAGHAHREAWVCIEHAWIKLLCCMCKPVTLVSACEGDDSGITMYAGSEICK